MAQEYEYPDTLELAKSIAAKAAEETEEDVAKYFLDFSVPSPRPNPVIYDPNNPDRIIVSECNIFAIIGEQKSYKSFLASLLVIDFFHQHPDRDCILIDTEQAEWNVKNVAKRVCDGMGWDYKEAYERGQLKIANLRPYAKKERLHIVEAIVTKYQPYLCIVDGIRDLVTSVNDDIESSDVVDKFMAWSANYNCAIGTILHTNKDGETARGHTGFELLAKCEMVLMSKGNGNGGASVKSVCSRNLNIESFDFEIDPKTYVPKRVNRAPKVEITLGTQKQTTALRALKVKAGCSKAEWLNDIRYSQAPSLSEKTAEKYFTEFVQFGYLVPDNKDYTFFSHKDAEGVTPMTDQPDTQTEFVEPEDEPPF